MEGWFVTNYLRAGWLSSVFCSYSKGIMSSLVYLHFISFLTSMCSSKQQIVYQNLYLSKACRVNFLFNATQCETQNLQSSNNESITYEDEANQVQGFVSSFLIYTALLENLPGVFFVLFLGPWSNEHGRKPLMMSPIFGFTLMTIIMMANLYFESWPIEYTLFGSLVFGLCGGAGSFFMASSRYNG